MHCDRSALQVPLFQGTVCRVTFLVTIKQLDFLPHCVPMKCQKREKEKNIHRPTIDEDSHVGEFFSEQNFKGLL